MQNRTNQFQHPCSEVRAAHTNCQLQKPNNLVLIEPSTVHGTHTHFYQTNYRGGPLDHETSLFLCSATRQVGVSTIAALIHNTIQLLLEISNFAFVMSNINLVKHLLKYFGHDKSSSWRSDDATQSTSTTAGAALAAGW